MRNVFGNLLRLTIRGSSHGPSIGGKLTGLPPGLRISLKSIQGQLDRRRPGKSAYSSPRQEKDQLNITSGLKNSITTGSPILFNIANNDAQPDDYSDLTGIFRPSHADYTYYLKYGLMPPAGGSIASGRMTACMVAAGGFAACLLAKYGIKLVACTAGIGTIEAKLPATLPGKDVIYSSELRCPDKAAEVKMNRLLTELRRKGDTTGGLVECRIAGCPPGLGDPLFAKLQAGLAAAMFSIPAVKGFEYGSGFSSAAMKGSEHNDPFVMKKSRIYTSTNNSGGIQGGISNGMDINFRIAVKPVSSIHIEQRTIDINGRNRTIRIAGRHDVCIVPRVVPVVEAMACLVIADALLSMKINTK